MEFETVAAARVIYEQLQADTLAETPLASMSEWVASGRAPNAIELRSAGLRAEGAENADQLRLARHAFIRAWGFSIPCKEAVSALTKLSPLVEIGAGTGYWTSLLSAAGADILATDAQTSGRQASYGFTCASSAETLNLDAVSAVRRYPERDVLCSWPSQEGCWDAEAALSMRQDRFLALIATPRGGIAGSQALFDTLEAHFSLVEEVEIPQFPMVHDKLSIYRRLGT
jgi:hypothetical protein